MRARRAGGGVVGRAGGRPAPWSCLALVGVSGWAAGLRTQDVRPLREDCDFAVVEAQDPADVPGRWMARHPNAVVAALRPLLEEGRWVEAADRLVEGFQRSGEPVPEEARRAFGAQLRAMRDELRAVRESGDLETLRARADGVDLNRFQLEADPDREAYLLFPGTDASVVIDGSWDPDARRDLCWRALAAGQVLGLYGAPGRERVAHALGEIVALWDNYIEAGYSQYPWETLVNGWWWGRTRELTPPGWQVVLFHPSVGVEVVGSSLTELRRVDAAVVEVLGVLRYRGDRTSYLGVSGVVTLPGDREVGAGALVHLGRVAKVGYVWRRRGEDGKRQDGVVLSADVYGWLAGVPDVWERARGWVEGARAVASGN